MSDPRTETEVAGAGGVAGQVPDPDGSPAGGTASSVQPSAGNGSADGSSADGTASWADGAPIDDTRIGESPISDVGGADPANGDGREGAEGSDDAGGFDDADGGEGAEGDVSVEALSAEALSVEALVADLERVTAERDQYLETSRRLQAEFENYRKQVSKRELEARERANEGLILEMLPVLDAFDGALISGVEEVLPMRTNLLDSLGKQGLERIDPADAPFDPNQHEAVMHDPGDGTDGPVVAEVMRAGYSWKGRVIRPAMVRVKG